MVKSKSKNQTIKGDGNCLFRAFSLYLHKTQKKHGRIRLDIYSFIETHRRESWIKNWEEKENKNILIYCSTRRLAALSPANTEKWGDFIEIMAFKKKYNINIRFYINGKKIPDDHFGEDFKEGRKISLNYVNSNHYELYYNSNSNKIKKSNLYDLLF